MAKKKKVANILKLQIPAGAANPSPPVGPALGQAGLNIMDLTTILFILSLPFVLLTVYFGTKNDFYESENYKGDGCAHDVKR